MPKIRPIPLKEQWSDDRVRQLTLLNSSRSKLSEGLLVLRNRITRPNACSGSRIPGGASISGGDYAPPKAPNDQGRGTI